MSLLIYNCRVKLYGRKLEKYFALLELEQAVSTVLLVENLRARFGRRGVAFISD